MAIRVLHVFSRMERGGAEMRTLDILRQIDRSRFHLEFCCASGQEGELSAEIRALGSEVHPVKVGRGFGPRFNQLISERRFDVVHSHLLHTSGWILQYAGRANVPVRVAHFRSTDSGRGRNPRRKLQRWFLTRLIDRHATDIAAVSEAAMRACWKPDWQSDARCRVIYNGLDLTRFQHPRERAEVRAEFGVNADAPLYIHLGNFRPPKNHPRVLDVFAVIAAQEPDARLLLVGKGGNEVETNARRQAKQLNLEQKVIFAGERSDVPDLLRSADLMLFPSLWEGLPGAVLEACAAGAPVLASALPVIEEITPRLHGLKYLRHSDSTAEWAAQARSWRENFSAPSARQSIADKFKNSIFNLDECIAAHCKMWSQVRD